MDELCSGHAVMFLKRCANILCHLPDSIYVTAYMSAISRSKKSARFVCSGPLNSMLLYVSMKCFFFSPSFILVRRFLNCNLASKQCSIYNGMILVNKFYGSLEGVIYQNNTIK